MRFIVNILEIWKQIENRVKKIYAVLILSPTNHQDKKKKILPDIKKEHSLRVKENIHQEDTKIVIVYAPNRALKKKNQ